MHPTRRITPACHAPHTLPPPASCWAPLATTSSHPSAWTARSASCGPTAYPSHRWACLSWVDWMRAQPLRSARWSVCPSRRCGAGHCWSGHPDAGWLRFSTPCAGLHQPAAAHHLEQAVERRTGAYPAPAGVAASAGRRRTRSQAAEAFRRALQPATSRPPWLLAHHPVDNQPNPNLLCSSPLRVLSLRPGCCRRMTTWSTLRPPTSSSSSSSTRWRPRRCGLAGLAGLGLIERTGREAVLGASARTLTGAAAGGPL